MMEAVAAVIEDHYFRDFLDIYGTTISITEMHPEQVNNEIRNALTHIARALVDEQADEVADNIEKAKAHIERAKRDCLKLSIIAKRDQIRAVIVHIEMVEGALPRNLKRRLVSLERQRKAIFRQETNGSHQVGALLETLLVDTLELEEQLLEQFSDPGPTRTHLHRLWERLKTWVAATSFAILCGILATYMTLVALPEDSPILAYSRAWLANVLSPKIFPPSRGRIDDTPNHDTPNHDYDRSP